MNFYIIFIVGAVQGFFLSVLLFQKKGNRLANRMLAVLVLLYSLYLAEPAILRFALNKISAWYFTVMISVEFLFGAGFLGIHQPLSSQVHDIRRRRLWRPVICLIEQKLRHNSPCKLPQNIKIDFKKCALSVLLGGAVKNGHHSLDHFADQREPEEP